MADVLHGRPPFAWLRERDIDLLFCSELHARGKVAKLLAEKIGDPTAAIIGAWVSHMEVNGESDLVVELAGDRGRVVALIENKIAAPFQPDQGARYQARADRLKISGVSALTILMAPSAYFGRDGTNYFSFYLSYEEIASVAEQVGDGRSVFFAKALQDGVESYRRGYVAEPDAAVSDMWMACWKAAASVAPKLRFQRPGQKPGRSTWFYFREAEGFGPGASAVIVYKAERGQADLQFAGTAAADLQARLRAFLAPGMKVVPAAKSASVRLDVPKLDFSGSPDEQQAAICAGLNACEGLRTLYAEQITTKSMS